MLHHYSCPSCGKEFSDLKNNRKFCSNKCFGTSKVRVRDIKDADLWFWSKINKVDENSCWEWKESVASHGYGTTYYPLTTDRVLAHRMSFFIFNGRWPSGIIQHSCDNRRCCNPRHLKDGTIKENAADAVERNRLPHGEKCWAAKLSSEKVKFIRQSSLTNVELGAMFGVNPATISRARHGKKWAKVT